MDFKTPETWEVLKVIVPAILSALLSGYWVSRWKARMDYGEKRLDELYDDVQGVADFASEYWECAQSDPKARVLEARVQSGIMRIARTRVLIGSFLKGMDDHRLIEAEAAFIRETT